MLTEKQIKERLTYIGASDAAAVLGLSRWRSPVEVWAEKTGLVPVEDKSDVLAIEVGTELEDAVCRMFAKRTGKRVHRVNETVYHVDFPFIAANLDRRVVGEDAILEAKTASAWRAKEWQGEDVPQEYVIQVLHQLAVTGKAKGYIAVLIGGNSQFTWKEVERDDDLIRRMIEKEVRFWRDFVEPKIMPAQVMAGDSDILGRLFPKGNLDTVDLPVSADAVVDGIKAMEAELCDINERIDAEKNRLRAMLRENTVGLTAKWKVSWADQRQVRVDAKRLRAERPEIAAAYEAVTEFRRLDIRKRVSE